MASNNKLVQSTNYRSRSEYEQKFYANMKADIVQLLTEFEKQQDLSYRTFATVWRKLKFSYIYCGLKNAAHARLFATEVFKYIQTKFLFEPSFNKKVACLYSMYGVYYKQPVEHFVKFLFSSNDWKIFQTFLQRAREKRQIDALYIACKLESDSAFSFVAFPTIYGPQIHKIKSAQETVDEQSTSANFYAELNKILNAADGLEDLEQSCVNYEKQKNDYKASTGNHSMVFFNCDVVTELKSISNIMQLENTDS